MSQFFRRALHIYSRTKKRSSATAEIARDADHVDFSADDGHSAFNFVQRDGTDEPRK